MPIEKKQIIRFMLIGFSNFVIIALVIYLMMNVWKFDYAIANVTAYTTALINNFFWSKYWVFISKGGEYYYEIPLFLLAFAVAYSVQFGCLSIMVEIWGMNEYLSQFLGSFVYGAINFVMNRKVTFRGNK